MHNRLLCALNLSKDADKIQATKHDPRKTKFGDFMRKTNIDELPQLINVFLGDMFIIYKTFANVVKGEKEAY